MIYSHYFIVFILINSDSKALKSQTIPTTSQSSIYLSDLGFQFVSFDYSALFLSQIPASSLIFCSALCHSNKQCRIFDYDGKLHRCQLFEGNIKTMGSIVRSPSIQSRVGWIELHSEQFLNFGQPCSTCEQNRYLTCVNGSCQCPIHTFFDGSICRSQEVFRGDCTNDTNCRLDLNYTCLIGNQCGPQSMLIGITVAGRSDGKKGSTLSMLNYPIGLAIDQYSSIYIADWQNSRVIKTDEGFTNGSMVAGTGQQGNADDELWWPAGVWVDQLLNIYVADSANYRVMLWPKDSVIGTQVTGPSNSGSSLPSLRYPVGITVDSRYDFYVSDTSQDQVWKWNRNGTNASIVAGTKALPLSSPSGIYLDEDNGFLYIADQNNHRIQRCFLNSVDNCTTVAGGNGAGTGSDQLNEPCGVWLSKKTNAIYIADSKNHRIQRWNDKATRGITVAGVSGLSGTTSILLDSPHAVVLNLNETYFYVSDSNNNRVQRFQLM